MLLTWWREHSMGELGDVPGRAYTYPRACFSYGKVALDATDLAGHRVLSFFPCNDLGVLLGDPQLVQPCVQDRSALCR